MESLPSDIDDDQCKIVDVTNLDDVPNFNSEKFRAKKNPPTIANLYPENEIDEQLLSWIFKPSRC